MTMSLLRFAFACSCLFFFCQPLNAADKPQEYRISLERPYSYGNYFSFKSEVFYSTHTTESLGNQKQSEEKQVIEAKMAGTAWVSDANERGEIAEVVIYPNEYSGKLNGKEVELTLGERLFVQMRDGELKVFSSAGHTMSPEVTQVIVVLLDFMLGPAESRLSKDDLFALDQPRQPGQSWRCDNKALAEVLNTSLGIRAESEQIQSTQTFVKVDKLLDEDAAELNLDVSLEKFSVPALEKRGLSVDKSACSVKVQRMVPIKKASLNGKASKQFDLSVSASADVPDQGWVQVQMITKLKAKSECRIAE